MRIIQVVIKINTVYVTLLDVKAKSHSTLRDYMKNLGHSGLQSDVFLMDI